MSLRKTMAVCHQWFCRLDRSVRIAYWFSGLLVLAGLLLFLPLMDRYHLHVFEADSPTAVKHTVGYMTLFMTGDATLIPPIRDYPPFFDGMFIVYGMAALLLRVVRYTGLAGSGLTTDASLAICAIRYVNLFALALAGLPLFAAIRMLCRRNSVALALALIFLLSPPILRMDLLRTDHVMILSLNLLIFFSLYITDRQRPLYVYIALGAITAFLANTKITAAAFAIIPVSGLAWAVWRRRCGWLQPAAFVLTAMLSSVLLAMRFVLLGTGLPGRILGKFEDHRLWQLYFPIRPLHYYNWEYFLPYGVLFIMLTALSLGLILWRLRRVRNGKTVVMTAWLILFSLLLIPMIKYPRGGYLLIPFYLLVVAGGVRLAVVTAASCWPGRRSVPMAVALAASLLLMPALARVSVNYTELRRAAHQRDESVVVTRILPREWFQRHVPAGSRVAIVRWGEYCAPPIWDLAYETVSHLLDPPILNPERMKHYRPPTYPELDSQADILLLDSFKCWQLRKALGEFAPAARAEEWAEFFDGLDERYQLMSYQARSPNYAVSRIMIYVLNADILLQPEEAFKDDLVYGVKYSPTPSDRETSHPVLFPWLGDYTDLGYPWLEHAAFGRVLLGENPSDESLWIHIPALDSWVWTHQKAFPRMLRQRDNVWLRYHRGTSRPLVFFNLATGEKEAY